MSDRSVQEQGRAVQRKAQVRPLPVFSLRLRNRLQPSFPQEGNQELQENGMASGHRPAPQNSAGEEVIRSQLLVAQTMSGSS